MCVHFFAFDVCYWVIPSHSPAPLLPRPTLSFNTRPRLLYEFSTHSCAKFSRNRGNEKERRKERKKEKREARTVRLPIFHSDDRRATSAFCGCISLALGQTHLSAALHAPAVIRRTLCLALDPSRYGGAFSWGCSRRPPAHTRLLKPYRIMCTK